MWIVRYALAVCLVVLCSALHEDEVGKWDWKRQGIGGVRFAALTPRSGQQRSRIVVASAQNVVAKLERKTGTILWSRHLGAGNDHFIVCLVVAQKHVVTAQHNGLIQFFTIEDGSLVHSDVAEGRVINCAPSGASVNVIVAANGKTHVATFAPFRASRTQELALPTGTEKASLVDSLVVAAGPGGLSASDITTVAFTAVETSVAVEVLEVQGALVLISTPTEYRLYKAVDGSLKLVLTQSLGKSRPFILANDEDGEPGLLSIERDDKNVNLQGSKSGAYQIPSNLVLGSAVPVIARIAGKKQDVLEVLLVDHAEHLIYYRFAESSPAQWTRHEGLAQPVSVAFAEPKRTPGQAVDKFGFRKNALVLAATGVLYSLRAFEQGALEWYKDLSEYGTCTNVEVHEDIALVVTAERRVITIDVHTGSVKGATGPQLAIIGVEDFIAPDLTVNSVAEADRYFHAANASSGVIRGYVVASGSKSAVPTWTVSFGSKLEAFTAPRDKRVVSVADALRVIPETSTATGGNLVRRKYPTANIVAVATLEKRDDDEPSTLIITAIDAISGSVLAQMRHENVEGTVRIILVEHMVIYHFLNVKRMTYYLGVWELFEDEKESELLRESNMVSPALVVTSLLSSGTRTFNTLTSRPPVVLSQLFVYPRDVAVLGSTVSNLGIAKKLLLVGTKHGELQAIDLTHLMKGGLANALAQSGQAQKKLPEGMIPLASHLILSHRNVLPEQRIISTAPTHLESTSHVISAGIDLFYARSSGSGKAFDVLNDDFDRSMLVLLCGGLLVAVLVLRGFAQLSAVKMQWA